MAKNQIFEEEIKVSTFGIRHLQCFLIFFGLAFAFTVRVNLGVAIVAMMDKNSTNPNFPEYAWSQKTKSILLSSFFWGYIMTQIPAGFLARKFGGKVMLLTGVLVTGLLSLLTPICAEIGDWQLICALRLVEGLSQGLMFPSIHTLLSKWAPMEERGTMGTICYTGSQFGTVAILACSGYLASSPLGWPSIFYCSGGTCVLWVAAWIFLGASSPKEYKSISAAEVKLIEASVVGNSGHDEKKPAMATPWKAIFTSVPFLALTIAHASCAFGFWVILTQLPTYMKSILGKDMKSNALLSSLPYLAMMLLSFSFCGLSHVLARYRWFTLTINRKLFNTIGEWVPMVTLVAFGYVTAEQSNLAMILLIITVGFNAAIHLGFQVNHIDLSPNFAGILMGITNSSGNMMSLIAPLVVGVVVTDVTNPHQWRIIFFITSGFYFIGNLLFVLFGETKVQSWNDSPQTLQELKLINSPPECVVSKS